MVRTLLLIGIGGAAGSILRYLVAVWLRQTPATFPYGTLAVNILGCLLIGVLAGLSERFRWFTDEWRIFLSVGFCGGFTTFSAFALENIRLLQNNQYGPFLLYTSLSLVLGLVAVVAGNGLARL